MEEKEIKIKIPSGMEIDKENSTFECIKFKPIENKLPKTWIEFCKTHPRKKGESWVSEFGCIKSINTNTGAYRDYIGDRILLPNNEYAKAMLALCQLIQLRDCYNDGWIPNWNDIYLKYTIAIECNCITATYTINLQRILAFKTPRLCDEFLTNFRDLIETAKPLL